MFYAKDGSTMLDKKKMDEVFRIDSILRPKVEVNDSYSIRICHPLCELNTPLLIFWKYYQDKNITNLERNHIVLDFPMTKMYDHDVFVGLNMFGVNKTIDPVTNRSVITHVGTIVLWYFWHTDNPAFKEDLRKTAMELFALSKAKNLSTLVDFDIFSDGIANAEMMRGAYEATKLMCIGFFLLLVFVFTVVWHKVERRALPVIVFTTVLSPFLAAATAFGIVSWLQFPIYSIMCVTPFLILGIGVDDAFIMLQSWAHSTEITNKRERMSKVFVEIGPSVSITSVTNTVAFGIGYFSPAPQMSIFCLCTSLACITDYILTFSLLAPVLVCCTGTSDGFQQPSEISRSPVKKSEKGFIEWYSTVLCGFKCKIFAVVVLILMYSFATYGVLGMKSTFEPDKAFPSDSPLMASLKGIKTIFTEFFPLQVIISKPPNISDAYEYRKFYEMVTELEKVPQSYGRNHTLLFLKSYEAFDRKTFDFYELFGLAGSTEFVPSYKNLAFYLEEVKVKAVVRMGVDEQGKSRPIAFQMTVISYDMAEWSNRAIYVDRCRSVVARYPEFNASVHDSEASILDLILTVKKDLIGSVAVTVLCMAIVCLFFVPNRGGLLIITFTISSICYTLIGGLSWWGADLDPVTMVDVLIATGFSVDYTAHIAYRYYRAKGNAQSKLHESFTHMSAPMLQAGLSTVLCMLPVIYVLTYAILALAKTVFLVVLIGLFHGLFFLPVLLATFTGTPDNPPLPQKVALCEQQKTDERLLL
ncbi:unnamed protein product [Enterobius vermicularis]|uniref:SSD domain-containing protein n=1 Tax=Enterobius vermicularis TaxID=51028 RepID=A0A0N4UYS0_ENTVE|nr:unnamed protein product [Enterobius vermicularis]